MAVQVAQAAEPQAPTTFSDSVLSPVSKLEVARKHAAAEQQRRIDEACARMVEVKKENANKRKALEEKLESHKKTKVQRTVTSTTTTVAAAATTVAVSSVQGEATIVKKLTDNFDDDDEKENAKVVQQPKVVEQQQTTVTTKNASYDATQELLRATRTKLNELVDATEKRAETNETVKTEESANDGEWNGPSTNYHLKQLGLTAKKIDIYAPVEVQQQELRRLRDRSRYGQTLKLTDPIDDNDSENDSDFVPEEATDENDADDDSDAESIPEVDADETQQLVEEAAEHEQKLRRRAQLVRIPVYFTLFCIVVIASLAAVEFTQRHYTICPPDTQSLETDDSVMSCASFLHARATMTAFVQDSVAAAAAFAQETAASIRSGFEELTRPSVLFSTQSERKRQSARKPPFLPSSRANQDASSLSATCHLTTAMSSSPVETRVLSFAGERELVSAERAQELITAYADVESASDVAFTHITLRNKSYTIEAARVIAGFFARLHAKNAFEHLTSVDFADMIAGRPEDEALQVLATLCDALKDIKTLTRIDLSDNALGEKGVRACYGLLLEQEHLQHVYFCNNGISAAAAGVIADEVLLYRGPETSTKLETFHFYNNMSGDGGAIALAKLLPLSPALRDLRFSATRAQRVGSLAFAKALSSLHKLERLDLSDNTFKAEGGVAIAAALKQQANLVELNLRDTSLEDDGMVAIARALADSVAGVTALDVSGNDLTAESVRVLAQAVRKLQHLRVLQVEENEIGSKGAKALAKAIKSHAPRLEKLVSNVNEIGTSGAVALAEAVVDKLAFTRLDIDGNAISGEGVAKIMALLEAKKKSDVLGSLEENDGDGDEDDDEDDEEEAEVEPQSTVDSLAAQLDKSLVLTPEAQPLFEFANKQREVVDAARAHALLAAAGIDASATTPLYYTAISLRGKSYTEDGAQVIADAFLGRLKELKVADLADVIAGRHEDEALRVLAIMCRALRGHVLDEIDLGDNALGEKGVRACFDLLIPQPTLRRLLFCNNGISAAAAGVIAQEIVLQNGADATSTLEEFHFYNNMSGHDGCLAVANVLHRMTKLTAFRYASARAGPDASAALARNIGLHLTNLTSLDVSDCTFEDEGADALAAAVGKQSQLRYLKLRDASLGVDGATKVVKALAANNIQLLKLDLSGNELEDDGVVAIASLLKAQRALKVLRLDENEITSEGVKDFVAAVGADSFPELIELSLIGNEITAKGALAVVNTIVPTKQHLQRLELDTNQISDKGVAEMEAVLARLGKSAVLGSLQENDGDEESDDE